MGLFDLFGGDPEHRLDIIGEKNGGRTDYAFESTGKIDASALDSSDKTAPKRVKGHVNGGTDTIGFNGAPKGIAFGNSVGDYRLELDGQRVYPFHIQMRTLEIRGHHQPTPYSFSVSESGKIIGTGSMTGEDWIRESETEAGGAVGDGGSDKWHFAGNLQAVDTNVPPPDSPDWIVDGEQKPVQGNPPLGVVDY